MENYQVQLGVMALHPQKAVTLPLEDRKRAVYVFGTTGTGKTTLLLNMILQDVKAGYGAAYFDPHGDIDQLLPVIPPERKKDLVEINPSKPNFDLTKISLEKLIQERKVILINLAKGIIGEEKCEMVGKELFKQLEQVVDKRMNSSEKGYNDFFVYFDEAQNWPGAELQKLVFYGGRNGISITVSHQYLEQLDEETWGTLLGSSGTLIVFRCGTFDAEKVVENFAPEFTVDNLVKLPTYHAAVKTLRNDFELIPFQVAILPPPVKNSN